jgi:hypothetical protein
MTLAERRNAVKEELVTGVGVHSTTIIGGGAKRVAVARTSPIQLKEDHLSSNRTGSRK